MESFIQSLEQKFGVQKDPMRCVPTAFILSFKEGDAVVTIRIVIYEFSKRTTMEITNMTTLPDSEKGKGMGSKALHELLLWAEDNEIKSVTAVQVSKLAESFWKKNGFSKVGNASHDFSWK